MNKHSPAAHSTPYDEDYSLWSERQAALIRNLKIEGLDAENVAEEIESLGKSDRRELKSRAIILIQHLLKSQYQAPQRGRSWRASINEARQRIGFILDDSPSLRGFFSSELFSCYAQAKRFASDETGLNNFPPECPYTAAQLLDFDYLPQ